jgi:hypothetical protein
MILAIMQPYFMPYIGYFQLISSVDEFVIYDNIEFTKKGWINRNRILVNGKDLTITIPLKKDSDYLNIVERRLADTWVNERKKMLNRIFESYRKAPYFGIAFPIIEKIILHEDNNLFNFIYNSIRRINEYLDINTKLIVASTILIDHKLKAERKVIEICKSRGAGTYINSIGGLELYSKDNFSNIGIDLKFLQLGDISFKQFDHDFIPWLSIIDVMMFNSKEEIKKLLLVKALI